MNKYIIAIANLDNDIVSIDSVIARSFNEAEDKFIHKFYEKYNIPYASDWNELVESLYDVNILIGEIVDIETI